MQFVVQVSSPRLWVFSHAAIHTFFWNLSSRLLWHWHVAILIIAGIVRLAAPLHFGRNSSIKIIVLE